MVAWFIIAIATLGIFAFIAVNGVQTTSMTADAAARIETVRRLDSAVQAIQARAASPDNDGLFYLPAGEQGSVTYQPPADLSVSTVTPFGQPFTYCPFGNVGTGTPATVRSPNGSSYTVTVKTFDGRNYVVGGRPAYAGLSADPNLLGYLMAPRDKFGHMPSCNQVTYNSTTRRFEVPNGIVRTVSRNSGVNESRTVNARDVVFFVSPSGTGSGASVADPSSLEMALNFYRTRLPQSMRINMASGNYTIAPFDVDMGSTANLTLRQVNGTANLVFIDMMPAAGWTTGNFAVSGDLLVDGVTFDSETVIRVKEDRELRMRSGGAGGVAVVGGVAYFEGSNTLSLGSGTGNWSLWLSDGARGTVSGTLNVRNNADAIIVGGAMLSATNGAVINLGQPGQGVRYGFYLYNNGVFNCYVCRVHVLDASSYVFFNYGEVNFWSGDIRFSGSASSMIMAIWSGSRAFLQNTTVGTGTRPTQGIWDYGGAMVSGGASTIYQPTNGCWSGNIFSETAGATAGSSSAVAADVAMPTVSDPPTAAQIRAFSEAQATNARRSVKRQVNNSAWSCVS